MELTGTNGQQQFVTGEFGLPTVYKPTRSVRELRRLFSQYENLNKHLVMLKNSIQAVLTENGIIPSKEEKKLLLSPKTDFLFLLEAGHLLKRAE